MEAVIYASEEPVTLAQLIGLLGEEAQVELDQIAAAPSSRPSLSARKLANGSEPSAAPAEEEAAAAHRTGRTRFRRRRRSRRRSRRDQSRGGPRRGSATTSAPSSTSSSPTTPPTTAASRFARSPAASASPPSRSTTTPSAASSRSLKPPLKLSLQALETLAVIAYKQPVTAPEISEIRGVDSGGVLGSLMARKLINTAGRKQVIGRPILYKTTKDFLVRFGLKDINELPSIEEFEKMSAEFAEAIQEEIPMPRASRVRETRRAARVRARRPTRRSRTESPPKRPPQTTSPTQTGDRASVDGRIASLPPDYAAEDQADNPSAQEAAAAERRRRVRRLFLHRHSGA